jgi:hypothetical protein
VSIAADTGNTLKSEIEELRFETGALEERNQEGTETAVNVEPELLSLSKLGQSNNVVHNTVRKVGRRADKHNSVGVDQTRNSLNVDLVVRGRARDEVNLELEVLSSLVEGSVGSLGKNPIVDGQSHWSMASLQLDLHLRLCNSTLIVSSLTSSQAGRKNTVGSSASTSTSSTRRSMKDAQDHAHNLGLHLANTREDIRMDRIGNSELAKSLGLELHQLLLSVIDSARDISILPAGMIHVGKVLKLGANAVDREAIFW